MQISFENFISGDMITEPGQTGKDILWLRNKDMDVGGGRILPSDIDVLAEHPEADVVRISGLRQDTFEYFIKTYGKQLRAIAFFKNKLVEEWSLLGMLPDLEYVWWFANQRIDKLWDMTGNKALRGLCISDFTRLHSIDGIEKAPALEYFSVQDAVWDKSEIDSYMPLANTGVTHLRFGGKRILDGNGAFIRGMSKLQQFQLPDRLFSKEDLEWIEEHFPVIRNLARCRE